MSSEVIVAIIAFLGTVVGSVGGILASSKMTNYRLSQLEEKVNKHNNLIDRMYKLETRVIVLEDNYEEHIKNYNEHLKMCK